LSGFPFVDWRDTIEVLISSAYLLSSSRSGRGLRGAKGAFQSPWRNCHFFISLLSTDSFSESALKPT
jgi:hypothetical protein